MKKIISLLLTVCILLGILSLTAAAAVSGISVSVSKYDSASGSYIPATDAITGDLLLVQVSFVNKVDSLASLKLKLEYSADTAEYVKGSAVSGITGGSPIFQSKESYLIAYWSTTAVQSGVTSFAENVEGNVVSFLFTCTGSTGSADFTVSVAEAYSGAYKKITFTPSSATAKVNLGIWQASSDILAAFEALKEITYAPDTSEDSKADIELATQLYSTLSASDLDKFAKAYPELIEAYNTAWTRYYDLAKDAAESIIKQQAEEFLNEWSEILALTEDAVNEENYKEVFAAYKAYTALPSQVKAKLPANVSSLLEALNKAAKAVDDAVYARELADSMALDFPTYYNGMLWDSEGNPVSDEIIRKEYAQGTPTLAENIVTAIAEYNALDFENMSESVKAQMLKYGEMLEHYLKIIEEQTDIDEKELAILSEVADFTERWSDIFKLNVMSVGIKDKTALEMMLSEYDELSDDAKERLAARQSSAKQLLSYIESLEELKEDTNTPVPDGGTGETVVEKIIELEKEVVVEKPTTVEKIIEVQKIVTQTVEVPSTATEVKEVEVEKVVNTVTVRNTPLIVLIFRIIMYAAIASALLATGIYIWDLKKRLKGGNTSED